MKECSLGIDIGGTKIAAGLVDRSGHVLKQQTYSTPKESKDRILDVLRETVITFSNLAKEAGYNINGVGIGTAGQVNYDIGRIISGTSNITDWNNIPIIDYLKQYTSLPIYLDNDANTFAIAEYVFGEARGTDNLIGLTLGTGVGGGVISQGDLIRGEWGGAGELGHMTVNMNGPDCNCGSKGCIEVYASGTGIANRMKERLENLESTDLTEELKVYQGNRNQLTSKEVFSWYEAEMPVAKETINLAILALSYGIVNMIHTFNPSVIVLGGGLVREREWIATTIQEHIQHKGMSSLIGTVDIRLSKLGYDAGLIGASSQVWFQK
ncbi:ROK family protein [Ornithinibacillus caprae]|uniref:ROK family protein n=1 Tax=Ornithinibacillus caprae TaxID=2678566 RepID=UPI0012D858C7